MAETPSSSSSASSSSSSPPTLYPPTARSAKPVSEALLNEKWDYTFSNFLIRSALGFSFGVVFSVLLFKRRPWPAWLGLGFGAGRAYEEADESFKRGSVIREAVRRL